MLFTINQILLQPRSNPIRFIVNTTWALERGFSVNQQLRQMVNTRVSGEFLIPFSSLTRIVKSSRPSLKFKLLNWQCIFIQQEFNSMMTCVFQKIWKTDCFHKLFVSSTKKGKAIAPNNLAPNHRMEMWLEAINF